jgi:hypothetical protein
LFFDKAGNRFQVLKVEAFAGSDSIDVAAPGGYIARLIDSLVPDSDDEGVSITLHEKPCGQRNKKLMAFQAAL